MNILDSAMVSSMSDIGSINIELDSIESSPLLARVSTRLLYFDQHNITLRIWRYSVITFFKNVFEFF